MDYREQMAKAKVDFIMGKDYWETLGTANKQFYLEQIDNILNVKLHFGKTAKQILDFEDGK